MCHSRGLGDSIVADNHNKDLNEQIILSFLEDVVEKIKTEENPFELNQYRRLFRKVVPFTLRSYFAAYLLKEIDSGKPITKFISRDRFKVSRSKNAEGRQNKRGESRNSKSTKQGRKEGRPDGSKDRSESHVSLPDDLASTLFFSIGRNRRVFPRDIIYLIIQNSGIEREHIGDIRVLDNYSFVQILTESADKVIESLNGIDYRGRKLSVSFSKKRETEDSANLEAEDSNLN